MSLITLRVQHAVVLWHKRTVNVHYVPRRFSAVHVPTQDCVMFVTWHPTFCGT